MAKLEINAKRDKYQELTNKKLKKLAEIQHKNICARAVRDMGL